MRIIQAGNPQEVKKIMRDMRVDPYGIEIMAPKAVNRLVRIPSLPSVAANILKQEMLSFGGDAAVARGALTGKVKKTDCLLMGSMAQLSRLHEKLKSQPFGLDKLGSELRGALNNFDRRDFLVRAGRYDLALGKETGILGIINLTPDSFSGDGLYRMPPDMLVALARQMVKDGADIVDVGGESSRPGARPVSAKEEMRRVIPAVKALARKIKVPISVDTYKPEVAQAALENGASMINDIHALQSPGMGKVIARYKAAVILMHMKGRPRSMQKNPKYASLIGEIIAFLDRAVRSALDAGIPRDRIIIDPGLGFGKTLEHNLQILKGLGEFRVLGLPILVGPSRKSFLGAILERGPRERVLGTAAACVTAAERGAHLVRVHDVREVKEAMKVFDSLTA